MGLDWDDWRLWLGLSALGGAVYLATSEKGRAWVADLTKKGRRLTISQLDADLKVPVHPQELARAAGDLIGRPVSLAAYALARMLRSEEGSGTPTEKRYIAHVACNDAAGLAWDLPRLLTYSTSTVRNGFFGRQITRRYSTAADPYEIDLAVAESVLAERKAGAIDPTGGATKFVNPGAFGSQPGTTTYAKVRDTWMREGYEPFTILGAPDLVFFRRRRGGGLVT